MEVVRDLERLVAFPTVSNRPLTALAAHVAERFEHLGFRIDRFQDPTQAHKCSLIASIGPRGTDGLVLSGHMDVVPTEGQPWSSDPFKVEERDGCLYGRGTADMKGFFAVCLQALARIRASDYTRELVLIWTHDEEVGCLGSAQLAEALASENRPFPKACLIGEPTDFRILRMHPGHVGVAIDIVGEAAHSSRPDLGVNAIEACADIIATARDLARDLETETLDLPEVERPWVAFNIGTVSGGSAINIVPDACRLEIGYRPLPGMAPHAVYDRLVQRISDLGLSAEIRAQVLRTTPALLTREGTPLQHLLEPHASHPGCGAATFATDGGNLAQLGIEPLIFGPGSINVAHQADEYVPIDQLVTAIDVIEDVVRTRCCSRP
jgi:acetylornithine deacetylase